MERLTKHVKNKSDDYVCLPDCEKGCVHGWLKSEAGCRCEKFGELLVRLCQIEDILGDTYDIDRLRELVEADKAGRCVLHPLKAEDEVYIAILGRVLPFEVTNAVWYSASPTYKAMHGMHLCFVFKQDDIGKTVFLTREASEAALAKEADHE